jgi:hypothetical protein
LYKNNNTFEHIINTTNNYEECKNIYKNKLEICISDNKKKIHDLEVQIIDLERKISDIVRVHSNKRFTGKSLNFIYTNRSIINYLTALNTLDGEKIKYYNLTIQNLKEQLILMGEILEKNIKNYKKL